MNIDPSIKQRFAIMDYNKTMPISKKAYDKFIERIFSITGDSVEFECILAAFEFYIIGKPLKREEFARPNCYLAFEFLRVDIDIAMQRSAAARRRAALRRQAKEKAAETGDEPVKTEDAGQPHMQPSDTRDYTLSGYEPVYRPECERSVTTHTPSDAFGLPSSPFAPPSSGFGV